MKVLILGAGGAAANGFTRCLKQAGGYTTIGTNANRYDLELAETDQRHHVPRSDDPGYTDRIVGLARNCDLVHAQPDIEVEALARIRDQVPTYLPDNQVIGVCHDKWRTHTAWKHNDTIPQPHTRLVTSQADIPITGVHWFRQRTGAGGRGSAATASPAFAKAWIDRHNGWGDFTVADVLTAETHCWQSLWWRGRLIAAQGRRRLAWANNRNTQSGVSGITGVSETYHSDQLDLISQAAILAIDPHPHGVYGVDCAVDKNGKPNPTEINIGRFFTTIEFFARLGLNLPDLYCQIHHGQKPGPPILNPLEDGWLWIRGMDTQPKLVKP